MKRSNIPFSFLFDRSWWRFAHMPGQAWGIMAIFIVAVCGAIARHYPLLAVALCIPLIALGALLKRLQSTKKPPDA